LPNVTTNNLTNINLTSKVTQKMQNISKLTILISLLVAHSAHAAVTITDAWVRENAPGQAVGAAYMTLKSLEESTLVYVESPNAGSVEIHSMTMNKNVMKMRKLEELPLKAGKPEKLAPGGFHLMLFDLKKPLKSGEKVDFKLCFKDKAGNITHQMVTLPVKSAN
jgi:periplasmic copper chaperone A